MNAELAIREDAISEIDQAADPGQDLRVSMDRTDGAISAVGALRRVYDQAGPGQLARSLRIIRDAYGDSGLSSPVISGIGLLCARYDTTLNEARAVDALSKAHGGVQGLLNKAETIRPRNWWHQTSLRRSGSRGHHQLRPGRQEAPGLVPARRDRPGPGRHRLTK